MNMRGGMQYAYGGQPRLMNLAIDPVMREIGLESLAISLRELHKKAGGSHSRSHGRKGSHSHKRGHSGHSKSHSRGRSHKKHAPKKPAPAPAAAP